MADLEPDLAALRDAAAGKAPLVTLPLSEARQRVVAGNALCEDGPDVDTTDLPPAAGRPVPVRLYEPRGAAATLVYAHGGGWVTGDLAYSDELCRFLAAGAALRVVSVDYRLAPEHPFPAGLEDVEAVWHWAAEEFGGPVAIGGDSAGGNLAAAVALRAGAHHRPAFLLLLYPVLGAPGATASYRERSTAFPMGAGDMEWFVDHYLAAAQPDPPPADLFPAGADRVDHLPVTHLVLAGHDPLHDEGAAFAARLADAGVEVSARDHADLCHGFLRFTGASAGARAARDELVAQVRRLSAAVLPTHP